MKVSAIIVSRGDVNLAPVMDSLPGEWERLVWSNAGYCWEWARGLERHWPVVDCSVYGRYAAIEHASGELIYVQDDDCIVSDPQAIIGAWHRANTQCLRDRIAAMPHDILDGSPWQGVVCNMPPEFRHDFYDDHALVGFGAAFHRDAPARAFHKLDCAGLPEKAMDRMLPWFQRTCDIAFTALTPRVLIDVPKTNLDYAYGEDRMWRQPEHQGERAAMLELVKKVPQ
jgi:hypothetical protein